MPVLRDVNRASKRTIAGRKSETTRTSPRWPVTKCPATYKQSKHADDKRSSRANAASTPASTSIVLPASPSSSDPSGRGGWPHNIMRHMAMTKQRGMAIKRVINLGGLSLQASARP